MRVNQRNTFGRDLVEHGVVQDWIARARIWIEQVGLLVLKTAWLLDTLGNKAASVEISAIKIAAPQMATWVIDRAIQAHGGLGVSQDTPLAAMYGLARILRIADGPDEVHMMLSAEPRPAKGAARFAGSGQAVQHADRGVDRREDHDELNWRASGGRIAGSAGCATHAVQVGPGRWTTVRSSQMLNQSLGDARRPARLGVKPRKTESFGFFPDPELVWKVTDICGLCWYRCSSTAVTCSVAMSSAAHRVEVRFGVEGWRDHS